MAIDKIQKTSLLIPPAGLDTHIQYNNNGQLAGSSSFVINSSGHVGIGTNDPKDRLHVKIGSDLNWQFGYPSSSTTSLAAINDAENAYVLARIDANPLQINSQSGGGVAIGNTTPTNQNLLITENGDGNYPILEVWNTNTTANAKPMIRIGAGGDAVLELYRIGNAATTYINAAQVGNGNLAFQTEGNTKMVIANDGNVGIGTVNPVRGLHLEGDSSTSAIRLETTGGEWEVAPFYSTFTDGNFAINRISGSGNLLIPYGNVGINQNNPETRLHIGGTSQFIKMDSGSTTHLYLGGENDFFALSHNRHPSTGVIDDAALGVGVLQYEDSVGWTFSANTAGSFTNRMRIGNDGVVQIQTGGVYQDHRATTNPAITKLRSNVILTQGAAVDILNFRSLANECSAVVYINYIIVQVTTNRSLVYGKVAFPIAKRINADMSIGSENNIVSPTLYQYPGAGGLIGTPTLTWSASIISGLATDVEQVVALQLNFTDTNAVSNIAIAFDVEIIDTYFDPSSSTTFGAVSMETV